LHALSFTDDEDMKMHLDFASISRITGKGSAVAMAGRKRDMYTRVCCTCKP